MIEEKPVKRPGENGFFMITNADIYSKVNELDSYVKTLKHTFYLVGLVLVPVVSALASLLVTSFRIGE